MGGIDNLLLLLRQVSCKARDAIWTHPDAPVCDFDAFKHVGGGELRLLSLRGFIGIGAKRGDVDESDDPVISSCSRNDTSTVRMADEDGWRADSSQGPFYRGDIAFGSVEAVLGGHHFVSLSLKRGNYFAKA